MYRSAGFELPQHLQQAELYKIMVVMERVMYELLKSFPVQVVDFKWSSGPKVNKRIWFLTEQADVT